MILHVSPLIEVVELPRVVDAAPEKKDAAEPAEETPTPR